MISQLVAECKRTWAGFQKQWNRFWFESYAPEQLTLLRVSVGVLLFFFYSIRMFDLQWLYSEKGLMSWDVLNEAFPFAFRFTLLQYFRSDLAIWILHTLFLLSLLGLAWGRHARFFSIAAFVLHLTFLHRNIAVLFGADSVATYLLFYLCFIKSDLNEAERKSPVGQWSSVGFRMIQVQVCIVYIYSGLEKLKGVSWWKGEAIWQVFANPHFARWDFGFMAYFPLFITFATYLTLLWEIYFVVLIWLPRWRRLMLVWGVLFHLGIGLIVNIPYFALLMIASYAVFLTREEAGLVLRRTNGLKRLGFQIEPQSIKKI